MRVATLVGVVLFVVILSGCGGGGSGGGTANYRFTQVAVPIVPGQNQAVISSIVGVNNTGTAVGYVQSQAISSSTAPPTAVFTVSLATDKVTTINTGQLDIVPTGINDSGEIIATSVRSGGLGPFPVQLVSSYVITDGNVSQLQVPPGYVGSTVNAINNEGQMTGALYPVSNSAESVAYIHRGTGPIAASEVIKTPDGYKCMIPACINNSGEIVGSAVPTHGLAEAFLYTNGTFTTTAPPSGYQSVIANAVNDNGSIACTAYTSEGGPLGSTFIADYSEPFLLLNGRYKGLGLPGQISPVSALNNNGEVLLSIGEIYAGGSWHSLNDPAIVSGLPIVGIRFGAYDSGTSAINNEGVVAGVLGQDPPFSIGIFSPG